VKIVHIQKESLYLIRSAALE